MFEAICLSIRITCKANPAAVVNFEEALFLVFTEILQNDVQGTLRGVVFFLTEYNYSKGYKHSVSNNMNLLCQSH